MVLVGHAAYAGGLTGTGAYVLRFDVVPRPDGLHYTGSEHFTRLVTPCGAGAVDVDLSGTYQLTTFDAASHTTTTVEHATFRSRSGTGDLANVTGGWMAILREHNDGTNDARYSGSMTCSTRR